MEPKVGWYLISPNFCVLGRNFSKLFSTTNDPEKLRLDFFTYPRFIIDINLSIVPLFFSEIASCVSSTEIHFEQELTLKSSSRTFVLNLNTSQLRALQFIRLLLQRTKGECWEQVVSEQKSIRQRKALVKNYESEWKIIDYAFKSHARVGDWESLSDYLFCVPCDLKLVSIHPPNRWIYWIHKNLEKEDKVESRWLSSPELLGELLSRCVRLALSVLTLFVLLFTSESHKSHSKKPLLFLVLLILEEQVFVLDI